jgi:hypothetical protein
VFVISQQLHSLHSVSVSYVQYTSALRKFIKFMHIRKHGRSYLFFSLKVHFVINSSIVTDTWIYFEVISSERTTIKTPTPWRKLTMIRQGNKQQQETQRTTMNEPLFHDRPTPHDYGSTVVLQRKKEQSSMRWQCIGAVCAKVTHT